MNSLKRPLFFLLLLLTATPWCGPATALTAGILFSLLAGNPWPKTTAVWSKRLLQWSVVGLGFGVSIVDVWRSFPGELSGDGRRMKGRIKKSCRS